MATVDLSKLRKPRVQLVGRDGNAFFLLGYMQGELKKVGWKREEIAAFMEEAKSGDYDNLLRTIMKYSDDNGCSSCGAGSEDDSEEESYED